MMEFDIIRIEEITVLLLLIASAVAVLARREALRAQRSALRGFLRDRVISESSYLLLPDEVDSALMQENLSWPEPSKDI